MKQFQKMLNLPTRRLLTHLQARDDRAAPVLGERSPAKIEVRASASSAELMLYGEIGYWGITAGMLAEALDGQRGKEITVRVNSPGGDVFDGLAMYSLLSTWPSPVKAQIDGLAASAASIVMLGADQVEMVRGAMLMIHNAWGVAIGNASELRDFASILDQIDGNLADLYDAKTGMGAEKIRELMAAETWFNADQALEAKLSDKTIEGTVARARVAADRYRNTPAALTTPLQDESTTEADRIADQRRRMSMRMDLIRRAS